VPASVALQDIELARISQRLTAKITSCAGPSGGVTTPAIWRRELGIYRPGWDAHSSPSDPATL